MQRTFAVVLTILSFCVVLPYSHADNNKTGALNLYLNTFFHNDGLLPTVAGVKPYTWLPTTNGAEMAKIFNQASKQGILSNANLGWFGASSGGRRVENFLVYNKRAVRALLKDEQVRETLNEHGLADIRTLEDSIRMFKRIQKLDYEKISKMPEAEHVKIQLFIGVFLGFPHKESLAFARASYRNATSDVRKRDGRRGVHFYLDKEFYGGSFMDFTHHSGREIRLLKARTVVAVEKYRYHEREGLSPAEIWSKWDRLCEAHLAR